MWFLLEKKFTSQWLISKSRQLKEFPIKCLSSNLVFILLSYFWVSNVCFAWENWCSIWEKGWFCNCLSLVLVLKSYGWCKLLKPSMIKADKVRRGKGREKGEEWRQGERLQKWRMTEKEKEEFPKDSSLFRRDSYGRWQRRRRPWTPLRCVALKIGVDRAG